MTNRLLGLHGFWVLLLGTILVSCFFIYQPALADDALVISQVQITGGSGKTSWDFVEIYNPATAAVNLKGYRLVKRTANATTDTTLKSFTSDVCVPPQGYFLWANADYTTISSPADSVTSGTIANDNGVGLRQGDENTGTLIASASWGTTNNSFVNVSASNPAALQSLIRQSDGVYVIGASAPKNSSQTPSGWICPIVADSSSSSSSSGRGGGVVSKSSDIYISEIYPNPLGDDSGSEQIELRNDGLETVNLYGWILADGDKVLIKNNAYILPATLFLPQTYLTIIIPKNYFSLNNVGGDTVNLYNGDKVLMDSVSYKDDAAEGVSYQKIGGAWVWASPTLGLQNAVPDFGSSSGTPVSIAQIFPNPVGSNEGRQWVEFYNASRQPFSLKGCILDRASDFSEPSPDAYKLDAAAIVPANGFLSVTIPEDNFTFNAQAADAVRFFNPQAKLIEQINFTQSPEGQSFQKDKILGWIFASPTIKNASTTTPPSQLVISEILPNPGDGQEEFLELQNLGLQPENLKGLMLQVGDYKKIFNQDLEVLPQNYFLLTQNDLPGQLRNSGELVKLSDAVGNVISQVEYPKAPSGQSYAFSGGGYNWTEQPTPGLSNQIVLAAATIEPSVPAKKTATAKTPTTKNTAPSPQTDVLVEELQNLQNKIDALNEKLSNNLIPQAEAAGGQATPVASSSSNKNLYLIIAFLALGCFFLAFRWYFSIKSKP